MTSGSSKRAVLKQKVTHEAREFVSVFLYLALFLIVLATYRMLLLEEFHLRYFRYGSALIEALVATKIVMLGEYMRLGKKHEDKPLVISAAYKAVLFGLLLAAFHVLEETIKGVFHGQTLASIFYELRLNEILIRNLVVICGFISFFLFRETRRVLGEEKFFSLFFGRGPTEADLSRS